MRQSTSFVAGGLLAATLLGTSLLDATAGTASASAPSSAIRSTIAGNPVAKTHAEAAINQRLTDLAGAITLVRQTGWLGSDQTSLLNIMNGDISGNGSLPGLTALETTIQNETNPQQLQNEISSIYSSYRVYALVLPQVHLVRAADLLTATVIPLLQQSDRELKTAISQDESAGQNVMSAQAAEADLETQITAIGTDTNGLSANVVALTPAEWNANQHVLAQPRHQLGSAASAVKAADADIATALKDLR